METEGPGLSSVVHCLIGTIRCFHVAIITKFYTNLLAANTIDRIVMLAKTDVEPAIDNVASTGVSKTALKKYKNIL